MIQTIMGCVSEADNIIRRRFAKSYLLNISLDGSCTDKENFSTTCSNKEKDLVDSVQSCQVHDASKYSPKRPDGVSSSHAKSAAKTSPILSSKYNARERSHTSGSCDLMERRSCLKKRKTYNAVVVEETYNSSSESLNCQGIIPKYSGGSASDSLCSVSKEVKFVKKMKESDIKDERMILTSSRQVPFCILSILPFNSKILKTRSDIKGDVRRRHLSGSRPLSTISDTCDLFDLFDLERLDLQQDTSYKHLLEPAKLPPKRYYSDTEALPSKPHNNVNFLSCENQTRDSSNSPNAGNSEREVPEHLLGHYHPNLLDDPELSAGKHRTLLTFSSYRTSVIDYVRPSDLKKEINEKFKERFPYIQLSLTKLRSLKREMRKIACQDCALDYLTVAQAFVYFEKFILHSKVNKQNRKLSAGACLLLSAKMNDVKRSEIQLLIEKIENAFRINKKDLLAVEFIVLVVLEFSLLLHNWEVHPHYQRLLYES